MALRRARGGFGGHDFEAAPEACSPLSGSADFFRAKSNAVAYIKLQQALRCNGMFQRGMAHLQTVFRFRGLGLNVIYNICGEGKRPTPGHLGTDRDSRRVRDAKQRESRASVTHDIPPTIRIRGDARFKGQD